MDLMQQGVAVQFYAFTQRSSISRASLLASKRTLASLETKALHVMDKKTVVMQVVN